MFKLLSPKAHAFVDYGIVAMMLAAPTLFNFIGTAAVLCYVVAAFHLLMTLATAFPGGALRLIPFPIHGVIELVAGVSLLALPFILGFGEVEVARNFFMIMGLATIAAWTVTNYRGPGAAVTADDTIIRDAREKVRR